jgi:hypothetical protein
MATALKIIERAFSKIGVKAAETPLQPSEINDGLDVLNDMLATWGATGVLKGVDPVMNATDEVKAPRYSLWAIKANVAILLAGEYGIQVSQAMANDAVSSLQQMTMAQIDMSDIPFPSTLPVGSGNYDGMGVEEDFFSIDNTQNF